MLQKVREWLMKKKLKIVLLAVAGLIILYHLMFYHVVGGTDSIDENEIVTTVS